MMGLPQSIFLLALSLSLSPTIFSQAVPADAQIVIGQLPPDHPASPPPPPPQPTYTNMSTSTPALNDDDFDPFLAVDSQMRQGASWRPTMGVMRDTKHLKWGFLVYRVYYGDDEAWERFMYILNRTTDHFLGDLVKPHIAPLLEWTEMQNRTAFDGASKDDIREHFRTWILTRSVERDGPGVEGNEIIKRSPRYQACLYVDKEAMESATLTENYSPYRRSGVHLEVEGRVILINSELFYEMWPHPEPTQEELDEIEEEEWAEEEYDPIDGNTGLDLGWMYISLRFASLAYDTMSEDMDTWSQRWFYKRPPAVWDGGP